MEGNPRVGGVMGSLAVPHDSMVGASPLRENDIRTVFIRGFPEDAKDRELHNIVRLWPGYEGCHMVRKGDRASARATIGFAKFSSQAAALSAVALLDGLDFDADAHVILRASLARKNMNLNCANVFLAQGAAGRRGGSAGASGSHDGGYPYLSESAEDLVTTSVSETSMSRNSRIVHEENPPCNTLFIGALPGLIDEQAVREILGAQPGMVNIKHIPNGRGSSIAFVQFEDVESATAARASLADEAKAGSFFRVQFARSELNHRVPRGPTLGTMLPAQMPPLGGMFGPQPPQYFYAPPMSSVALDSHGVPVISWPPLLVPTWAQGGMPAESDYSASDQYY